MARIYEKAYFKDAIIPVEQAQVSVASSAVLYGLSVYTVFPVCIGENGAKFAFRLKDHYKRLVNSARIIGINTFEPEWSEEKFTAVMKETVAANSFSEDVFVRVTIHVTELVPGTRSRDMQTALSAFLYEAKPIVPQNGARLKTSVWRRVPDYAIPSRAKVNGAYVNSVLAKQDAIDSGYDDCVLLDVNGHVCELSAANIFLVRGGTLITPGTASDILEGITRKTVMDIAQSLSIPVVERAVDLTELYVADEIFACGTSAFIAPIIEVDARPIADRKPGPITTRLRDVYARTLRGGEPTFAALVTDIK